MFTGGCWGGRSPLPYFSPKVFHSGALGVDFERGERRGKTWHWV